MVSSKSGMMPLPGDDGRLLAYPTMFYPGTTAPRQASVVSLAAGEVRGGVDFRLQLIKTLRVSGTAVWPDDRPYPHLSLRLGVLTGWWEFAGGDAIAIVYMGSRSDWEQGHQWAVSERAEIFQCVASEVIRQQCAGCVAQIDLEGGWITLRH